MLQLQDDGVTVRCESSGTFSKTKTCKSAYLGPKAMGLVYMGHQQIILIESYEFKYF